MFQKSTWIKIKTSYKHNPKFVLACKFTDRHYIVFFMFSSCSLTLTAAWGSICKSESLSRIILSYNKWQCNIIRCMMAAVFIFLLLMVSGPLIQLVTVLCCVLFSSAYLWQQDMKRCSVKVFSLLKSRTGSLIIHYANNPAPYQNQVAFIILKINNLQLVRLREFSEPGTLVHRRKSTRDSG